ncbi:MAG: RHS repeat domain-containing protein [Planctomycetota bacterium]
MNQLEERADDLSLTAQHTHGATPIDGIGSVVVTNRAPYYQYPHYDHRGSLFVLEDTGTTDLEAEYNAFGEELERSGNAVTRFGYQGTAWMRLDSGLYVSPTRLYVPGQGRFGQVDPLKLLVMRRHVGQWVVLPYGESVMSLGGRDAIGDEGDVKLYAYARGAPAALVDPFGNRFICCIKSFPAPKVSKLKLRRAKELGPFGRPTGNVNVELFKEVKVRVEFTDGEIQGSDVCCSFCCEYRQLKEGFQAWRDSGRKKATKLIPLQEDISAMGYRYGHRDEKQRKADKYYRPPKRGLDVRRHGCRYAAWDMPVARVTEGEVTFPVHFRTELRFWGRIIDVCQKQDMFKEWVGERQWDIEWYVTVRRRWGR